MVDYLIVGGGIAGLYTAYKLEQMGKTYLLFEASNRLGGRLYQYKWYNIDVNLGAALVRPRDSILLDLCKTLKLQLIEHPPAVDYRFCPEAGKIRPLVKEIYKVYEEKKDEILAMKLSFQQFLYQYFSPADAEIIIRGFQYTDFLHAGVYETIYWYPLSDILPEKSFTIKGGWNALINSLLEHIDKKRIFLKHPVEKIKYEKNILYANNVATGGIIFATTKPAIQKIAMPESIAQSLSFLDIDIGTVPFTKIFTYHNSKLQKINGMVVTSSMPQRIVRITDHIMLAVYADEDFARYWKTWYRKIGEKDNIGKDLNTRDLKIHLHKVLEKLFPNLPEIDDLLYKYWDTGVHYWTAENSTRIPLDKYAHPHKNILVCGEMLSKNQGWCEGALESVNRLRL